MNIATFIVFISIVITIYSLLNYYFIRKHRNILTGKSLPVLLWWFFIMTMIATPIATVIFSQRSMPLMAAITGFPGYSWLAFLFLFLVIHGAVDIILFIMEKIGLKPPRHLAREIFWGTMCINIAILGYGYFEAHDIRVRNLTIETAKLPSHVRQLKIVQISDVHFSPLISVPTAKKIVSLVKAQNPDLIVSTGDLLDRPIRNSEQVAEVMRTLQAPLGKYAITGNHEFIAGIDYSMNFTRKAGFTVLRNRTVTINKTITLVGVDDPTSYRMGIQPDRTEQEVLADLDRDLYTVLLKHQPRIETPNLEKIDLQLSGHTHGGQIFPFTLLVRLIFPYVAGLYELDADTKLYVNQGTGSWGPPIRFLAFPEITVLTLKHNTQ